MSWNKRKVQRLMRALHRDIGYFAVGITLVYALSGFLLSHKSSFPATTTEKHTIELPTNLSGDGFVDYWNANATIRLNRIKESKENIELFLDGGTGDYDKISGKIAYEIYSKRPLIAFLTQLHHNQKKGWAYIADIYVFMLSFLAISGLALVNGKNGFYKRGLWIMLSGIIVVLLFVFVQ
ncbi:MAG: PepSY-associated TM helix domain-containing protein [Bacteroidales bacterium]|nr:PepSY-associated TM helix domain-containing protein [Bacteroidales bacterium]MDD4713139.1 PepSY-associated TM helix domain-containing protein [Bacteroidales bacterium]